MPRGNVYLKKPYTFFATIVLFVSIPSSPVSLHRHRQAAQREKKELERGKDLLAVISERGENSTAIKA